MLGPLLFLLYTNDLANASKFGINLFADDTCLSLSHTNLSILKMQCNTEASLVDEWFKANRLTTNAKKASNFMLSHCNTGAVANQIQSFSIKMGNVMLKKVSSVKYLGVIFDENLS